MNKSFPDASAGVKKVFIAEILALIAIIPMLISVILTTAGLTMGLVSIADGTITNTAAGIIIAAGVVIVIFLIIEIVAFILKLVGLNKAGHDQVYFKYAFGLIFVGILCTIGSGIFGRYTLVANLFGTAAEVCDVIVMIFIIYACMILLDEKGNADMVYSGYTVLNLMILVNIISVIARILPAFFLGIVGTIFMCLYAALSIVSGIMFLVFLKRTSKALA